jgi:SPP1 gp7 family putative phage head morphogenesis protein
LLKLTSSLIDSVKTDILPLLIYLEPEYTADGYAKTLEEAFDRLRMMYSDVDHNAKIVSEAFVTNSDQLNKKKFYSAMNKAVGVNMETAIQNEGLEDVLLATTRENVSLIKSIPEEYFKKLETTIFTGTTRKNSSKSMIEEIQNIGNVTRNRARLIARDQSAKLNSALTQQRSQNLGVEEYIWRTAEDGRVRHTHEENNGKVFRWDTPPPKTGHPGQDIQCRCVAQSIINL